MDLHIASARKIKQIDIIDEQYPYNKWTSHFRNYNYLFRKPFVNLSDEIFKLIEKINVQFGKKSNYFQDLYFLIALDTSSLFLTK